MRLLFFLCLLPTFTPAQTGDVRRVHDPAAIRCDSYYYIFSTHNGIRARRSPDLLTWTQLPDVFDKLPDWTTKEVPGARGLWAPDVSFFNGRYHLYYSVSTFGKNRSCIGLATNKTLDPASPDFRWTDHGKVVESTPGKDNFNAIDPNVVLDDQGAPWLSFGSFWGGIRLVQLDAKTGKPAADAPLHTIAARPAPGALEAPFIVRKNGHYYLFLSFDYCCKGVDSTYRIMVGRATRITGPYLDNDGKDLRHGGGTQLLASHANVRGPGHPAVLLSADPNTPDHLLHHYYDANERGQAKLQIRTLTWDKDQWPIAGDPITAPATQRSPQKP